MTHEDPNGFAYYESLDEVRADGLVPVKVKSLLEFFTLRGRTSTLAKENFIPLPCLKYCVLGSDKRYYVREFRQIWTIDMVYFYRKSLDFSGSDEAIDALHRYVYDDRAWLILDKEQVESVSAMLTRVYSANLSDKGKLPYRLYLEIAEASLKLEDYKDYGKNLTGFKTSCKIQEDYISGLFKQAYEQNKK